MRYQLATAKGDIIYTSLLESCALCLSTYREISQSIPSCVIDKKPKRLGKIEKDDGAIFACTGNINLVNSSKLFKQKVYAYADVVSDIHEIKESIMNDINSKTKRLLHNLTSLNAHNIQEVYNLIPQDLLTKDQKGQMEEVTRIIKHSIDETASVFLRIVKNNMAMKTEFSVFKKLYEISPTLQIKKHPIRKVFLNVFHIFFQDFTDKRVYVNVEECELKISLDYESFSVALYHLIDNSSKYILPGSVLHIRFKSKDSEFVAEFDMMSLKITDEDAENIFKDEYSGIYTKKSKRAGEGLGMGLIENLLKLNGAKLIIKRNVVSQKNVLYEGLPYENNIFELHMKAD